LIVLDSAVLLYAVGAPHSLAEPCRRLLDAVGDGVVRATTTIEVIQEFTHVRSRRRDRASAIDLARRYVRLLSPLLVADERVLDQGLTLFERHPALGSFDAVLAATAISAEAEALVSPDRAFAGIRRLRHVDPATPALDQLIS
jgi:predicted nucleic acid-binding protein